MSTFDINFLDHVALYVTDMDRSAIWYQDVLGLKKYRLPEWGDFPIFLLANKSGVALFPADMEAERIPADSKNVKIDHFAFNVTQENFKKAKAHYDELGLSYSFQNHHYFHSLYTKDPDGHTVELTTLVVDPEKFYKK